MGPRVFGFDTRILACLECGTPFLEHGQGQYRMHGRLVGCDHCGHVNLVTPRDDGEDRKRARAQPTSSEAKRREQLRSQEGVILLPPPAIQHLLPAGRALGAGEFPALYEAWQRVRRELAVGFSAPAAECLYFLTLAVFGHLSAANQEVHARASLDSALALLRDVRHRQEIHGMLARRAADAGDFVDAEQWLSLLTPYSDDLHADTAYRVSRAHVSAKRGCPVAMVDTAVTQRPSRLLLAITFGGPVAGMVGATVLDVLGFVVPVPLALAAIFVHPLLAVAIWLFSQRAARRRRLSSYISASARWSSSTSSEEASHATTPTLAATTNASEEAAFMRVTFS